MSSFGMGFFVFMLSKTISFYARSGGAMMSHQSYDRNQPVYSREATNRAATTAEQLRRRQIVQDWANVGLSADIMRPSSEEMLQAQLAHIDVDLEQQSYCCR
jgi:hypothetical protein